MQPAPISFCQFDMWEQPLASYTLSVMSCWYWHSGWHHVKVARARCSVLAFGCGRYFLTIVLRRCLTHSSDIPGDYMWWKLNSVWPALAYWDSSKSWAVCEMPNDSFVPHSLRQELSHINTFFLSLSNVIPCLWCTRRITMQRGHEIWG